MSNFKDRSTTVNSDSATASLYTESYGNITTKKGNRSNSSRHRGKVVTELRPEEVRWFYKEDKSTWKPFVGHDSLKIEVIYRKFCDLNPEKSKCCGPGPNEADTFGSTTGSQIQPENVAEVGAVRGGGERDSVSGERELDGNSVNVEAVCVREGLYEVDVKKKECYAVYWNLQDHIPVMRGQWFIDVTWLPLEEDESDQVELEHLARFRGQQMRDTYETEVVATTTVDSEDGGESSSASATVVVGKEQEKPTSSEQPEVMYSLKLNQSHVDWHSVDKVYLYSDATTSKIARTVTQKLGLFEASGSVRLHRGYVEDAAPEDTPLETTHIVFVVHGIGQKMHQGGIIRSTSTLRDAVRMMEERHFSDCTTEHVEFLPVEWRSKLTLDGDTVDSITLDKLRGIRDMVNSSALDIMYYTSPLFRDEITRGLTLELNRLYTLFCSRNPEFEENGKVSFVSHSLGCVITYDSMMGRYPVRSHYQEAPDPEETKALRPSPEERHFKEKQRFIQLRLGELKDQLQRLQTSSYLAVPALKFKVDNFFCLGSPLAVFLALRGIRPGNSGVQDQIIPKSIFQRLFNIFHPTDPVAYRLEPLILKHYSKFSPVQIHWYDTTSPTPYDQIPRTLLIPSPGTPGESIINLGKAGIMGAASIGKEIGGILFSRSSDQVGGVGEEPPDSEGGASEVEGTMTVEEGGVTEVEGTMTVEEGGVTEVEGTMTVEEGGVTEVEGTMTVEEGGVMEVEGTMTVEEGGVTEGEKEREKEEERKETEPTMSQSTSVLLDSESLERRVDFELREGMVESRYVSAVFSHTAYWRSHDVALFLLTFMYRQQDPSEPREDNPASS